MNFLTIITIISIALSSNVIGIKSFAGSGCPIAKEMKCPFTQGTSSKTSCPQKSQEGKCFNKNINRIVNNNIEIIEISFLAFQIELPIKKK